MRINSLLVLLALAQSPLVSPTITYAVGTCNRAFRASQAAQLAPIRINNVRTINGGGC